METYFEPWEECTPLFGVADEKDACPRHQFIHDGPGNRGHCDCDQSAAFMLNRDDFQCYQQFTRVKIDLPMFFSSESSIDYSIFTGPL